MASVVSVERDYARGLLTELLQIIFSPLDRWQRKRSEFNFVIQINQLGKSSCPKQSSDPSARLSGILEPKDCVTVQEQVRNAIILFQ
jgi:hypothetical protein